MALIDLGLNGFLEKSRSEAESRALQNDPDAKFHPRCESQQTKVFGMKRNEPGFWKVCKLLILWWSGTESNRRRQPFQGCALPDRLPGRKWQSITPFRNVLHCIVLVERKPVGRCSGNAAGIVKLPSLQASSWSSLAPSGIRAKRSAESPTDSGLPSQSSYAEAARPQAYHHRAMFTEPQLLIQRLAGVDERRLCAIVNISSSKGSRAGREEPGRSRSPGAIRGLRPAQKAQSDHRGQRKISKLRVFNDPEHCNSRRLHHSI